MAYERQTWVCGETITADKLNHIEEGIENCCGINGECAEAFIPLIGDGLLEARRVYFTNTGEDVTISPSSFAEITLTPRSPVDVPNDNDFVIIESFSGHVLCPITSYHYNYDKTFSVSLYSQNGVTVYTRQLVIIAIAFTPLNMAWETINYYSCAESDSGDDGGDGGGLDETITE